MLFSELLPTLLTCALILIGYDLAQKAFIFRLLQKAKDEKEREAIIAAFLTRRWR